MNILIGYKLNLSKLQKDDTLRQVLEYVTYCEIVHNLNLEHYTNVSGVPFYFNKNSSNIGLLFSGGTSDTLLLYILVRMIKYHNLNVTIHLINYTSNSYKQDNTEMILSYIRKKYDGINIKLHAGFLFPEIENKSLYELRGLIDGRWVNSNIEYFDYSTSLNVFTVVSHLEYLKNAYEIETVYSGAHKNTWQEVISGNHNRKYNNYDSRYLNNTDAGKQLLSRYEETLENCDPFLHVSREWIAAQYEFFRINDIKNLTRSCNADLDLEIFGSNYMCGECESCLDVNQIETDNIFLKKYHNVKD